MGGIGVKIEAKVIVVKCGCGKYYGVRVEKRAGKWVLTWAFPLSEKTISKENYSSNSSRMSGTFEFGDNYPGCPYCGSYGIVMCNCGKISCATEGDTAKCNWCNTEGRVRNTDKLDLSGSDF